MRARILMVDNHDSFVHTLVDYLTELGGDLVVVEADEVDPAALTGLLAGVHGVVVSPGPGIPENAGASIAVVRACAAARIPLLGVCLGHQAIAAAFGASVAEAPELMHGMTSDVVHDGSALFTGIPSPFSAGRYHSLAVVEQTLPAALTVTARTVEGTIMALAHVRVPIQGVQFHPESVLTENGYRLLGNWLAGAGVPDAAVRGSALTPHRGKLSPRTP